MDLRETVSLSLIGLLSHKLQTLLTMLGIIFGVAAVIAMLSIGEGAKQESLEQIRQMGISNIIVQHWDKEDDQEDSADADQNKSQGLTWDDARSIERICLLAEYVTPQRELKIKAQAHGNTFRTMAVGTTAEYLTVLDARIGSGVYFSAEDLREAKRVCVLGADAKRALFFFDDPLGSRVKIRNQWFTVIGVLADKGAAGGKIGGVLEVRNTDEDIYIPLTTMLSRFHWEPADAELSQITVKISASKQLQEAAAIVRTILNRRHRGVEDFKIAIPEELLRQSEERFRDVLEVVEEVVWETNLEGQYTFLSKSSLDAFGVDHDQAIGMKPADFVAEDERAAIVAFFRDVITERRKFTDFQYRITTPKGRRIWVSGSGAPLYSSTGELVGYRGTAHDVTAKRLAEEALRQGEESYRSIFDNAQVGIIRSRISDGKPMQANDRLAEILG